MQAARGASLSSSDTSSPSRVVRWPLFAGAALLGLLVDQLTKEWAVRALADDDVHVLGDWFRLRLVFNPGAAFSTGTEYTVVFTCLAIVAVGVVLFLAPRVRSRFWALGLGLLLAGVGGNLVDRVFRDPRAFHGHVVDFLSFGSFPVFNVADMMINMAAAVIIIQSLRGIRLDGSREADHTTTDLDEETR